MIPIFKTKQATTITKKLVTKISTTTIVYE
jgi:hypothetical protein